MENSIVHGFSGLMDEMGFICLTAHEADGFLFLEIRDNGKGMSEEEMNRILNGEEEKEGKQDHVSIGITNVKTRLTLNYGESCEFEMESEKGRFTRTSIRIPVKRKEPEDL